MWEGGRGRLGLVPALRQFVPHGRDGKAAGEEDPVLETQARQL